MIYTDREVKIIRDGGKRLAVILGEVAAMVRPGITTAALDAHAEARIRELGGAPSFLGYHGSLSATPFPSSLCTSINEEVVHAPAVPARILKDGDIIGLDIGMRYPAKGGYCSDMAVTVGVGKISADAERLINVTKEALQLGIAEVMAGVRVRDIGRVIQRHVESAGYSIVRELTGHGVGREVHEEPEIPNFAVNGTIGKRQLKVGMVIAIEPMVNAGSAAVKTLSDRWTVVALDQNLSAHFEHTIAVTKNEAVVLTIP